MSPSKQSLTPEQKKLLLKKLRSKAAENKKEFHIINAPSTPLASATIINIPLFSHELSKEDLITLKNVFSHNTIMVNHYSSPYGDIGLLCIPYFLEDLSRKNFELVRYIKELIPKIEKLGAKAITLAGNLSSATGYLESIKSASNCISTGHATTVASVLLTLDNLIKRNSINMKDSKICFLGMGSIGKSSFEAFLALKYDPKEIFISDTLALKPQLNSIKSKYSNTHSITVCIAEEDSQKRIYDADIIIGATNTPDSIDITQLKPGAIILDDSSPHCFDTSKALNRIKTQKDIIACEAGMIETPYTISEHHTSKETLGFIYNVLPGIFTNRSQNEMTSCILSGLLSSYGELPLTVGPVKVSDSLQNISFLKENNYSVSKLKLDGNPLESIM